MGSNGHRFRDIAGPVTLTATASVLLGRRVRLAVAGALQQDTPTSWTGILQRFCPGKKFALRVTVATVEATPAFSGSPLDDIPTALGTCYTCFDHDRLTSITLWVTTTGEESAKTATSKDHCATALVAISFVDSPSCASLCNERALRHSGKPEHAMN